MQLRDYQQAIKPPAKKTWNNSNTPYLVEILDSPENQVREIVVMKGTSPGFTTGTIGG